MLTSEWVISDTFHEGKQMVNEGLEMMVDGVKRTLESEIRTGTLMGIVGFIWGLGSSAWTKKNGLESAIESAGKTARWGAIYAWWTVGTEYNLVADEKGLPKTRISDWLISAVAGLRAYYNKWPFHRDDTIKNLLATQLVNQETVAGTRRLANGFYKMALA